MKKNVRRRGRILALTLAAILTVSLAEAGTVPARAEAADSDYGLGNPKIAYNYSEKITFGSYWQEDTNNDGKADKSDDKQPITWSTLKDYGDGTALVVSDKILDAGKYFEGVSEGEGGTDYSCTWMSSTVRNWLNGEFYKNAFTTDEQEAIIEEDVINDDNPAYGTTGGIITEDKVFLLSLNDVTNTDYGFVESTPGYQRRSVKVTAYAKSNGVETAVYDTGLWWLRSPGCTTSRAMVVDDIGGVSDYGSVVNTSLGIRPALRINLSSSYVKKTGEKTKISVKGSEWDTVTFGKYDGKDISWRVLNVSGDNAFLVSDKILTAKAYNDDKSITWKDSTIRNWLNTEFFTGSFTEAEQNMILNTTVKNDDNDSGYNVTEAGEDTEDKVFLLSLKDIIQPGYGFSDQYLAESESRIARNSEGFCDWWWLRSPGNFDFQAARVDDNGKADSNGLNVINSNGGIRPALIIDLKSSAWTKGEKVTAGDPSGGKEEPVVDPSSKVAPTTDPTANPTSAPTPAPADGKTSPTTTVPPTVSPAAQPAEATEKDNVTTFKVGSKKLKNKKTIKKTSKIKITDKDKIKKITLNGKSIKIKKNKTSFTLKLKNYKKKLKKKGKWNTLKVTDDKGNIKTVKFKTK